MTVADLKAQIQSNTFDNFLIFAGEEYMVQKIYIRQIAKVRNLTIQYIDSVSEIFKRLGSVSMFNQNYLYVVREDKEFMQDEVYISEVTNRLANDVLILLCTPDKRLKFYKGHKDTIIEFEALNGAILKRYIQKEIDLSDSNCALLAELCNNNYGECLLEIDKIKQCMKATQAEDMPNNTFEMLVADGTIYTPPKDAIFDFVKAVLQGKPKLAYALLEDCKAIQEPTLVLLSVLYQNTRAVLQVQTCTSGNIEKSTGLTGWQIRNAKECVGVFSEEDLMYLLQLIQGVEQRIKQGLIEDEIGIDYVLAKYY